MSHDLVRSGSSILKKGKRIATSKVMTAFNPVEALREISSAITEYGRIRETERTNRREIKALERTCIEKIRTQRELLIKYFDLSFDERQENFRRIFDMLDTCVSQGQLDAMAQLLSIVVDLANYSPLETPAVSSGIKKLLEDSSTKAIAEVGEADNGNV